MFHKLNPIERVQLNIEEKERDKIRQVRIQSMTEQYLEKLNLKNNVYSQQKKKEDMFNKKLQDLKQLKSFVNVQERLSRMNAFNNIDFILKVNKRKIENNFDNYLRQPAKKEKSLDELLDETKEQEFSKSYIQFIQGYSQKKQQNSDSQEISQENQKRKYSDNTNALSRKFSTKLDTEDSPPKFASETKRKIRIQKPKAFLPKDFNVYYEQFKEQSEMIISQAKMEAKMRYLKELDESPLKVRRSQSQKLLSFSPDQNKTKTQQTNKSPQQRSSKLTIKSSKSKILNDIHINDDIISQLNLLKQTCSKEVDESEKIMNKKLMRRMSSAFDLINEKYQGQKRVAIIIKQRMNSIQVTFKNRQRG
ncbi:hypothetical protein pb186bvf_001907 [Paramecium bursaria]